MCEISGKWRKNLVPYHFRLPCVVCSTCCMYRRLYIVTCLMGHINVILAVLALPEIHFVCPPDFGLAIFFGIAIFVCGSWVMTRHQDGISAVVPRASWGWLSNRTGTSLDDGARKSNNWLDQMQSGKSGTGSGVQSSPRAFPSSTDVPGVLLLNQPIPQGDQL